MSCIESSHEKTFCVNLNNLPIFQRFFFAPEPGAVFLDIIQLLWISSIFCLRCSCSPFRELYGVDIWLFGCSTLRILEVGCTAVLEIKFLSRQRLARLFIFRDTLANRTLRIMEFTVLLG